MLPGINQLNKDVTMIKRPPMHKIFYLMTSFIPFFTASYQVCANNSETPSDIILSIIDPLITASKKRNEDGKFYEDDLPAVPYFWKFPCDDKIFEIAGLANLEDPNFCPFIESINQSVKDAVCHNEKTAYKTLARLATHYFGVVFTESQSLYLERRAKSLGMTLPFYQHLKETFGRGLDYSLEPQLMHRVGALTEAKKFKAALNLLPDFAKLCSQKHHNSK